MEATLDEYVHQPNEHLVLQAQRGNESQEHFQIKVDRRRREFEFKRLKYFRVDRAEDAHHGPRLRQEHFRAPPLKERGVVALAHGKLRRLQPKHQHDPLHQPVDDLEA
eukprot:CAMPEP_0184381508 /NCGR_PEP_ID=MMETSP0007-20130409/5569_1 /TAXON_ID=97485 /ORGANISM="Prymnesium parvum, Strain Texoma1" /LENGTH=107 /DNA_ID=CAMNT_0026727139 /DNA_START=298 /DNA_END=622 /DNA_ORIENTATION=+